MTTLVTAAELRPATPIDDAGILEVLAERVRDELAPAGLPGSLLEPIVQQQLRARDLGYRASAPHAVIDVIVVDDVVVGVLLVDRSTTPWRLVDFVVRRASRSQGLGSWALAALLDEAAESGASVALNVRSDSPARSLYATSGFVVTGHTDTDLALLWAPEEA
jgi:GNAT superfamily N-acetyltransferase